MSVRLVIEERLTKSERAGIARPEILRRAKAMVSLLQLEKFELSLLLTNDDQVQDLNKIYRGKDRPTDVLAFAMREGDFAGLAGDLLGDVIVSIPTAKSQAKERNVEPLAEVTMLVAHGLLHLLGWDHETAAKDRAMRAETDRLCAAAERKPPRQAGKKRKPATKKRSAQG